MRRIAFLFSLALTSTLTACDTDAPSADEAEFFKLPPSVCGRSGGPYGSCNYELSNTCGQELYCFESTAGSMCVPYAVDGQQPKMFATCKAKYGSALDCASGVCFHLCDEDADCLGGTVCSEIPGVCVWPTSDGGDTSSTG